MYSVPITRAASPFNKRALFHARTNLFIKYLEVKHLKQLVRNIIDPTRDLGHVDRHNKSEKTEQSGDPAPSKAESSSTNDTDEKTIPIDPDAGVARGPLAEEGVSKAGREEMGCNDCK